MRSVEDENIQTGSRLTYLGRSYYVTVNIDSSLKKVVIEFNHSSFNIFLPERLNNNADIKAAFEFFKKEKAKEKLTPRFNKWVNTTGLEYSGLKFTKLQKQWGSCSTKNNITINWDAIQLPWPLIDYLIVHELVHTKIKNHSKEFWTEVLKHIPNFKELDARMGDMRV